MLALPRSRVRLRKAGKARRQAHVPDAVVPRALVVYVHPLRPRARCGRVPDEASEHNKLVKRARRRFAVPREVDATERPAEERDEL